MSDIDVFTIDDDFDPLAEIEFDAPEQDQTDSDYLPPIPDADKSIVPAPVPLSADERIERLLSGLPGQTFRVLAVVQAADSPSPRLPEEVIAEADERQPARSSVYDTARLLRLLVEAGAIEELGNTEGAAIVEAGEDWQLSADNFVEGDDGEQYLTVVEHPPARYQATEAGRAAVARYLDAGALAAIVGEEPRYAPLYARIFALANVAEGATTADLGAAIDADPLCFEPRRFSGYFIDKLEKAGLMEWRDTWTVTDLGRAALATGVLDEY